MERKSLSAHVVLVALLTAAVALGNLTGCTSLFFQPTRARYPYLELDQLSAETVELHSADGTKISAWKISSVEARKQHPEMSAPADLNPGDTRGIALQFHGNAQNMTTHYRFQLWLLFEGWDVLTFDYRGYGSSEGDPSNLDGVLADGVAAIDWANSIAAEKNLPLVIFGQSLGATLAIGALESARETPPSRLKLLVLDSAFYSFRSIAREKLSDVWFLWPFQWLGWLLVSDRLSAADRLEKIPATSPGVFATPAIFLHSKYDPVVSNSQGERLYALYPGKKERWTTDEPGHVNTLFAEPLEPTSKSQPPKTLYREKLKKRLIELAEEQPRPSTSETSPTSK